MNRKKLSCAMKMNLKIIRLLLKIIFIVLNIILFLIGATVAIVILWAKKYINEFIEKDRHVDAIKLVERIIDGMLTCGACQAIIALYGCLLAICLAKCCGRGTLTKIQLGSTYALLMFALVVCQIVPYFMLICNPSHYGNDVKEMLYRMLVEEYKGVYDNGEHKNNPSFIIDALNIKLDCCGINGWQDFEETDGSWRKNPLYELGFGFANPITCCKFNKTDDFPPKLTVQNKICLFQPNDENSWLNQGCWERIEQFIAENSPPMMLVFWIIILMEVVCIVLIVLRILYIRRYDNDKKFQARNPPPSERLTSPFEDAAAEEYKLIEKEPSSSGGVHSRHENVYVMNDI